MGGPTRLQWLLSASLAIFAASGTALAQQSASAPPAAEAEASEEESNDDIVIEAEPGDQVRIDRRTYTLRDDPVAQSTNMFEILGRIPSVSVAPSGDITLLGASNVTIQINGQPVQGANLEQVLRGLQGSEVERIEVITNPSAQYSAEASGGIINIITRRRFDAGFNGSIQASADTLDSYHFGVAPSWSSGPWSFSGQVGLFGGGQEGDFTRERQEIPAGAITAEEGRRVFEYDGWYASRLQAAYSPSEHHRMSLSLSGNEFNFQQDQMAAVADASGPLRTTEARTDTSGEFRQIIFDFQQTGDSPREVIKLNAALNRFTNASDTLFSTLPAGGGASSQYATMSELDSTSANLKLDVERPLPDERFLTFGVAIDRSEQTIGNALQLVAGAGPLPYDSELEGVQQTLAAYSTFQTDTGDWTWLPGLRAEYYQREVASAGLENEDSELRLFPSLHIRNELTRHINVDLSYTSRIQRPSFQALDPALRFFDVNRASVGNPNLEPTTTDAYEANFVYQKNGASFSLTFFDRISEDIFSSFTEVTSDGTILTTTINAGTSEQRGLQALLRGPIGDHWRYSLSANVLSREFDFLSGGTLTRREELEYDGVAQLDYREPDQDVVGADQVQFEVRFQGPWHSLQSEYDAYATANFTWRRRLAPRLFGVLTVQDIFDSSDTTSEITTDTYFERSEFSSAGTRVRLALTYQFGSGPQRPPEDQSGGPPIPGQ